MKESSVVSYICSRSIDEEFNDNPLLEAALSYAERGWPVIALHTPVVLSTHLLLAFPWQLS